ncbi:MAG: hypothetical protein ACKO1U_03100, partial [Bacteroidota bacterium]
MKKQLLLVLSLVFTAVFGQAAGSSNFHPAKTSHRGLLPFGKTAFHQQPAGTADHPTGFQSEKNRAGFPLNQRGAEFKRAARHPLSPSFNTLIPIYDSLYNWSWDVSTAQWDSR